MMQPHEFVQDAIDRLDSLPPAPMLRDLTEQQGTTRGDFHPLVGQVLA